jgi:murein DD-endopeptidase MepM/ murein hydrolase activator NlpD
MSKLTEEKKKAEAAEEARLRAQAEGQAEGFDSRIAALIKGFLEFLFGAFSDPKQAPNFDDAWGIDPNDAELKKRRLETAVIEAAQASKEPTTRLGQLIVNSGALKVWGDSIKIGSPPVIHTSPVAVQAQVTSLLGERDLNGDKHVHAGIDLAPRPPGTKADVLSSAEGVVIFKGWKSGYGNTVMIGHNDGSYTLYGHLASIDNDVKLGGALPRGEVLGVMGNTGLSLGVHLHYEQRTGKDPRNPLIAESLGAAPEVLALDEMVKPTQNMIALRAVDAVRNQFSQNDTSLASQKATRLPTVIIRGRS